MYATFLHEHDILFSPTGCLYTDFCLNPKQIELLFAWQKATFGELVRESSFIYNCGGYFPAITSLCSRRQVLEILAVGGSAWVPSRRALSLL